MARYPSRPFFLAVVETRSRSSADNFTPSSRAKQRISANRSGGMPVAGQLRIVEGGRFRASATAPNPPKRPRSPLTSTSNAVSMLNEYPFYGPRSSPDNGYPVSDAQEAGPGTMQGMGVGKGKRQRPQGMPAASVMKRQAAARLEAVLEAKGWQRQDLTRISGIPGSTLNNYFNGTSFPPWDLLYALANEGVSMDFMVMGVGPVMTDAARPARQADAPVARRATAQ